MNTPFRPAPAPVSDALILICEKCGKKLAPGSNGDENPAKILQNTVKEKIRERFGKGKLRCVISSCLDVCPKGELTVAIVPIGADAPGEEFYTFKLGDPKDQADEIIALTETTTTRLE